MKPLNVNKTSQKTQHWSSCSNSHQSFIYKLCKLFLIYVQLCLHNRYTIKHKCPHFRPILLISLPNLGLHMECPLSVLQMIFHMPYSGINYFAVHFRCIWNWVRSMCSQPMAQTQDSLHTRPALSQLWATRQLTNAGTQDTLSGLKYQQFVTHAPCKLDQKGICNKKWFKPQSISGCFAAFFLLIFLPSKTVLSICHAFAFNKTYCSQQSVFFLNYFFMKFILQWGLKLQYM